MNKLLVLFGRPGCGKTTLIEKFVKHNSAYRYLDVYTFVRDLKDQTGLVGEDMIIKAYERVYQDLNKAIDSVIFESGTKHPEYNLKQLAFLSDRFKISLIFCHQDIEICRQRCLERQAKNLENKYVKPRTLEIRLKRPYPDIHQRLASEFNLPCHHLDMSMPFEDRINFLNN